MSLTEVLEEVTKLSKAERRQVIEVLLRDEQITRKEKSLDEKRDELYRHLVAEGALRVPASYGKTPAPREFEPVTIKGKPLSETIIEERR